MATANPRAGIRRFQFIFPTIAVLLSACAPSEAAKSDDAPCVVADLGAAIGGGRMACIGDPEPIGM
jgi:hypothetical protein